MLESRLPRVRPEVVLLAFGIGILLWLIGDILLMVFAGVLLAVALTSLAGALTRIVPIPRGWSLAFVTLSLGLALIGLGFLVVPQAIEELETVIVRLLEIFDDLQQWVAEMPFFAGGGEGGGADDGGEDAIAGSVQDAAGAAANAFMAVLGVLGTVVVVIVIGVFMAASPSLYIDGFLKLVPIAARERARETMALIGYALRWWLLGQLASMTVLGVLSAIGLWLAGIDLWLGLAALTALLTFVPFLGPIIAGIAVVSVAFADGVQTGLIILAFFVALQNLEGYIMTPLIQQKAVLMPPALLIAMQVLLGSLFGAAGLILAAPLTAAGLVAVNLLYVEDVLGDRRAVPDRSPKEEVRRLKSGG
jgi:predicted PurR-regulated permease PerM